MTLTAKQIQIISLGDLLKGKTPLESRAYGVAGKMMNRFGFALCAEVFQNMPDLSHNMRSAGLIESIMQKEYLKRNPQGRDQVLAGLSEMIGR